MVIALVGLSMMTSCSMWNNETNGAILGGVGGAILGGALGEVLGGPRGGDIGSQIGATIGTVAGASAGREQDRREIQRYYSNQSNGGYYDENYQKQGSYYDEQSGFTYVRMNNEGDFTFKSGSTTLTRNPQNELNNICKKLLSCNNDVYVYGSADSSERNAVKLSEQRAKLIANQLMSRGVLSRRIHIVALGSDSPIGDNSTSRGRALNRSVEVFLVK
ncbi:MAG: OmpA family protein [Muribaculaceae bacterium]